MATMARLSRADFQVTPSGSPRGSGPQAMPSLLSQERDQGAGSEVEFPGLQPEFAWDASVTSGGLTHYATVLTP